MNRERIFSSVVVAVVGLFYLLSPYEMKANASIDFGLSPGVLVLLGILLIIVSIYNLFTKSQPMDVVQRTSTRKVKGRATKRRVRRKRSNKRKRRR